MFLLDTNACIQVLTGRSPAIVERLSAHHPADIRLCSIVKAELLYGAFRSSRPAKNLRLVGKFVEPFESLPFDDRSAEMYGRIRSDLAGIGMPIGPNDLMIAAIAIAHGLSLVTANESEFGRVPGLKLVNWDAKH